MPRWCRSGSTQQFKNSLAETLTETEKAFQLGFVAMSEAILVALAGRQQHHRGDHHGGDGQHHDDDRARTPGRVRHAQSAWAFHPASWCGCCLAKACSLRLIGGLAGLLLTLPLASAFSNLAGTLFPVFRVSGTTMALQAGAALLVGMVAAAWPAWKMSRIDIVAGLRHVG